MSTPSKVVSKLLEDEDFSLEDIKDYVAGQKVSLADGIEFHIGFAIGTSGEGLIGDNARDHGIEPDWDAINAAIGIIERNAENALRDVGINCRNEGHDNQGDLVGSAWVTGGTPGFEIVKTFIDMGEPYRTSSGTIGHIKVGLELSLYAGVSDEIASLIDVDIYFFDIDKIEHVENGGELEEDDHAEDPKDFVNRPDIRYAHPVWDIPLPEVRQWLRNRGYVVRNIRRRKRGSIAITAERTVPPPLDGRSADLRAWVSYDEVARIAYDLEDFTDKLLARPGGTPIAREHVEVRAWGWPPRDEHQSWIDIEIIKTNTSGEPANPYS